VSAEQETELALLHAQAKFQRGRLVLASGPIDDALRSSGQADIKDSLRELQPIAESGAASFDHRRRARALAGWIQIALQNPKSAENHFRASLAFADDATVELGLAHALIMTVEKEPGNDRAAQKLDEAKQILDKLDAMGVNITALRERLAQLE
jgi:hypothetical protein